MALKTLLASTAANSDGKIEEAQDEASANECCVCIGETGAFQALFLAPCSHCFHYKCVSHIIVQSALFQCPLCRQVANLTASVSSEDLPDLGEIAIGALGDKKYFDAPKATSPTSDDLLQVPSPSDGNNSRTSTGDKKNKDKDVKRKSSFTSKLGLFLGRRLSGKEKDKETPTSAPANAGSAGGSGSNNTTSPSAVSALSHIDTNPMTPTSPHQRSSPSAPVAPSQVSAPINPYSNGPHLQFAPDVVVEEVANLNQAEGRGGDDEENDPNYEYASGGGGSSRGNGGIPRSTTMQTMDSHNAETNMVGDELVLAVPEAQNAVNGNSS